MKHHFYRSAAVAVLIASGSLAGAGLPTMALAQEQQAEEPPIPMDKVREKRGKNACQGSEEECAAQRAERKQQRQEERAERREEREEERVERREEREEEPVQQAEEPAQNAEEPVQQAEEPAQQEAAPEQAADEEEGRERRRRRQTAEEPAQQEAAPEQAADEEEGRERRRRRDRAEGEQTAEPEMTVEEAREEQQQEPQVSEQAEKPKEVAEEPIEQQLEKAEEEQTAVVPDQLTEEQADRFKRAERRRRERARDNRLELLGAAAVGAVIGAVIPQLGGRVQADEGDRLVINQNGELVIHKDESSLLRGSGSRVEYERLRNGRVREIITRPNGVQIITVKDPGGYMLRRVKVMPNGDRYVLFDVRDDWDGRRHGRLRDIPRYRVDIPRDRYIVSARRADRRMLYDTFQAEPVYVPQQRYTLAEIRQNEPVRAMVRRVDLDTINFAFGSAFVEASQVDLLGDIAGGMLDVIDEDPETVFLIEGHTDAVGSEVDNLVLSDRRAEAVARILVDAYGVPPENLVTQGYGEEYLKVDTAGPELANRRATVRNITPILDAQADQ